MGLIEDGAGLAGAAVGPTAGVLSVSRRGAGAGPDPDGGALTAGRVAVISATVLPSAAGGEVRRLELVDRLVICLNGPEPVAVLPTDLLVRTGPGELVIVCPAPAEQRRVMAVVDEIRATAVEHLGPGPPIPAELSITVAFAGSGTGRPRIADAAALRRAAQGRDAATGDQPVGTEPCTVLNREPGRSPAHSPAARPDRRPAPLP